MDTVGTDYPSVGQHAYPAASNPPAGTEPPSYESCSHASNAGISSAQVDIHQPFYATSVQPSAPPGQQIGDGFVELFSDIPSEAIQDSPNDEHHGSTPVLADVPQYPTESFQPIPGYESAAYDMTIDIPPPPYEPPLQTEQTDENFSAPDELSEKVVRDAILTFVDEHCCYGSRPAKHMTINSVVPSVGLHYQLETFTEGRSTRRAHLPFRGGYVDMPECGRTPLPWEITCEPVTMFETHHREVEVPHTSVIKPCFRCSGCGLITCSKCSGSGRYKCSTCFGKGYRRVRQNDRWVSQRCYRCSGSGKVTCSMCSGSGTVTCPVCEGCRELRHFIVLDVNFTNHPSDYILEETDMPAKLIRDVSGEVIFQQTLPIVQPISQYSVQQVNDNSIRLVNEHLQAWPNERILKQRHNLRSVPVSEVAYTWKNVNTRFWVYGYEHRVYAPDYPHQCCCGCNIL